MISSLLAALVLVCALGSGLMAGLFFAFSCFVMTALGRLPAPQGIAAMQSINIAVLNPLFFSVFFGTAVAAVLSSILALTGDDEPGGFYILAGGVLYLYSSLLVTIASNIPRNNALAAVDPRSAAGAEAWRRYLSSWTAWNHVRTIGNLLASAAFILAFR